MDIDFADVKPSVLNLMLIGAMATTFIVVGKLITTRWYVYGLSELFRAV